MEKIVRKNPQFIIFTDKDGTLNLKDKQASNIFQFASLMNGMIIPVTGRTPGDIAEKLIDLKLPIPEIIVGDNGAVVYSKKEKRIIHKKELPKNIISKIISKYIEIGGNINYIRYTNGEKIFAHDDENVREYYKDSNRVNFYHNIIEIPDGITKVTISEDKEILEQMKKYVESLNCWTDGGNTTFPNKDKSNYRLDIGDEDSNKGKVVKDIVEQLKPIDGFICVGNGENDISMFKVAIDNGMLAAIVRDDYNEHIVLEMKEYAKGKKGKVVVIPRTKELANKFIRNMERVYEKRYRESKILYIGKNKHNISEKLNITKVETPVIKPSKFKKNITYNQERAR